MVKATQAFNPFLPSYEYLAGVEAHVFDGRVYVYGCHDKFNEKSLSRGDYVCWSADENDLKNWRYEGVIFRRKQVPHGKGFKLINTLFAPDVCKGADGNYYLYFTLGFTSRIGVAISPSPVGKFEFLDFVRYEDGSVLGEGDDPLQFDPAVFIDDDNSVYLFTGYSRPMLPKVIFDGHAPSAQGMMGMRLHSDMKTVNGNFSYVIPSVLNGKGTSFEGHEYFEAPSMRKFNGKYYLVYSSVFNNELCYATSDKPFEGYTYGGELVSCGDLGLNGNKKALNYYGRMHGSIEKIKDDYYVFYHRHTNGHENSRQACAERLMMEEGKFQPAELTSCGLNGGPLKGSGEYKARIACHLFAKNGAKRYGSWRKYRLTHPYFTQLGPDREHTPSQYIANFRHGATAGFKYFNFKGANQIIVTIKGSSHGKLIVSHEPNGKPIAKIRLTPCKELTNFYSPLAADSGVHALYFTYEGLGHFDFKGFILQKVVTE